VRAVLVIAGSDSSGGAGVVRDVRTLADFGTPAMCALTAVTAQSDTKVTALHPVPAEIIRAQILAAFATREIAAIKIGMLGTRAAVLAVAETLAAYPSIPVVLDPVLLSTSGAVLLDTPGREALRGQLLGRATLLTPNIPEAAALLGREPAATELELLEHGRALLALGAKAVLLKGGHGSGREASDLLLRDAQPVQRFPAARSERSQRGTGCALASAIAAALAAGADLDRACAQAKQYVSELLVRGNGNISKPTPTQST